MISIFVLYSNDRLQQLEKSIACLQEMPLAKQCQKILVTDGPANVKPADFEVIEVQRPRVCYNWSACWSAGIAASKYETVLYLDCDRVLPLNYLSMVAATASDGVFLYPERIMRIQDCSLGILKQYRLESQQNQNLPLLCADDERIPCPPDLRVLRLGKNPFSGNTAFRKATYLSSPGVDPRIEGFGFPDTDLFIATAKLGFQYVTLPGVELHLAHSKRESHPEQMIHHCWNAYYVSKKWGLELEARLHSWFASAGVNGEYFDRFASLDEVLEDRYGG